MTMFAANLERAYSVAALRRMARRRLPRMVFDFCDGGAEDEVTRDATRARSPTSPSCRSR